MSTPEPGVFAAEGAAAFNRLDVEAVLAHFHDDVVFTSPVEWRAKRGRRTVLAQCTFPNVRYSSVVTKRRRGKKYMFT